jgi:transposase
MVWGGRGNVRDLLYMAALTGRRCNPVLRTFYRRLLNHRKPLKVALTACMCKLLVILNAMLKHRHFMDHVYLFRAKRGGGFLTRASR